MEEDGGGGGGLGFMELLTSGKSILLFDGSASSSTVCFSGKQEEEREKENSKVSENSKKIAGKRLSTSIMTPKTECPASATSSFHGGTKRRKEKLGDRITALQQLVSPFGKVIVNRDYINFMATLA
ncbi:transcription factor bHLH103-like isoform X3 [Zingiber officinale]|uniref:transcription factor bHLH103-like isoform X3 n=1 Tax=Zingiber officinale TaxID=94328 RepID=UPI001C4C9AE3|nr:transcription factor bHLH103-like isoform X3 [Zingiber officinale]